MGYLSKLNANHEQVCHFYRKEASTVWALVSPYSIALLPALVSAHSPDCHPAYFNFDHMCSWPFKALPVRVKLYRERERDRSTHAVFYKPHQIITPSQPWEKYCTGKLESCTIEGMKCWKDIIGKDFTLRPFLTWYPRRTINKMVHLSCWKFSLGPSPCYIHLFGRIIYPWLIWGFFKGEYTTAVCRDDTFMIRVFYFCYYLPFYFCRFVLLDIFLWQWPLYHHALVWIQANLISFKTTVCQVSHKTIKGLYFVHYKNIHEYPLADFVLASMTVLTKSQNLT